MISRFTRYRRENADRHASSTCQSLPGMEHCHSISLPISIEISDSIRTHKDPASPKSTAPMNIIQLIIAGITVAACSSCAIQKGFEFRAFLPSDSRQEFQPESARISHISPLFSRGMPPDSKPRHPVYPPALFPFIADDEPALPEPSSLRL